MKTDPISLGIVGVGHLGEIHTRLARNIESIHLAGIYDINPTRAQEVAGRYETRAFQTLSDLLQGVQAVILAVPTEMHFEIGQQILASGKHLFIEKPITSRTDEARALIDMARRSDLRLQVGHIERFNPAFLALNQGSTHPLFIEAHRLCQFNPRGTDVSVILDLMIHDIDIVLTLISSPVQTIHACGVPVVSDSEDIANVRLSFQNGSVANLTASRISAKDMRKMRLFQRNSYISVDFLARKTEILSLAEAETGRDLSPNAVPVTQIGSGDNKKDVLLDVPAISEVNSLELELGYFAAAVQSRSEVPVPGEDGLRALEVAEVILEQIKRPQ